MLQNVGNGISMEQGYRKFFFCFVISVDISKFVILVCNIEKHFKLTEDFLRSSNKASTLRRRMYP